MNRRSILNNTSVSDGRVSTENKYIIEPRAVWIDTSDKSTSFAADCTRPLTADGDRGNRSYRSLKHSKHSSSYRGKSNGINHAEATVFGCQRRERLSLDSPSLCLTSYPTRRRQYPQSHGSCWRIRIVRRFQLTYDVRKYAISPASSPRRLDIRKMK